MVSMGLMFWEVFVGRNVIRERKCCVGSKDTLEPQLAEDLGRDGCLKVLESMEKTIMAGKCLWVRNNRLTSLVTLELTFTK